MKQSLFWCWPKPVQAGGPPVLLGVGATKGMPKRSPYMRNMATKCLDSWRSARLATRSIFCASD